MTAIEPKKVYNMARPLPVRKPLTPETMAQQAANAKERRAAFIVQSHIWWSEWHTKEKPTQEWVDDIGERVPQLSCSCKSDTKSYFKANPPDFTDWPRYAWKFHNYVNRKRGVPELTFEQSETIWRKLIKH